MAEAAPIEESNKTMEKAPTGNFLLVAAIDFGTAYSGYALSFKSNPMKIQTNQGWNAGSKMLISHKTPTCVLLNPQQQFDSFGYDAENKYANLLEDGKHQGWMFFRRFKMILHNIQGLTRKKKVKDINGKKMSAMKIFSMAINYMRNHVIDSLKRQVTDIEQADVMFVLTVPAIWSDASKQFMREAAIAGGIEGDHLKLVLEPEAASVWCQQVETGKRSAFCRTGSKYMVVDMGGGTVDVSVHEKNLDGTLKELHRASGGPWGGTLVNDNFIAWLSTMFGDDVMKKLKGEVLQDYFDLLREFEMSKRKELSDSSKTINFRVPVSLCDFHKESNNENIIKKIERLNKINEVNFKRDMLRVSPTVVRSWFQYSIDNTIAHITGILAEPAMKDVNTILLVGGFAECKLVQEAMTKAAGSRTIVIPEDAGLAVLKGAVRLGHQPRLISSRCVKYTYGYQACNPFNPRKHPQEKMFIDEYGDTKVGNCFLKVVEIGTSVEAGKDITAPFVSILCKAGSIVPIFASTERDLEYTTDPSCTKVGELRVGKAPGKTKYDNGAQVYFAFGDTELRASVKILKTSEVIESVFDCL